MSTRTLLGVAALVAATVAGAFSAHMSMVAAASSQAGRGATQTAAAGTVTGRITFAGTAAKPRLVRMSSDPLCMKEGAGVTSEVLIVGPGNGLQNAFVSVKDGLGSQNFPAPKTPVVLNQKGCRYLPHVFGVQVGQPVEILNSDPTLHNVHGISKQNKEFNFGQPKAGMKTTRVFDKAEIMVPFRCDVHGWMNAYAGVVPHPFFAVSAADGSFTIKGLPPGTYTIEAWHERLGTQSIKVTVDAKTGAAANFTFKGGAEAGA